MAVATPYSTIRPLMGTLPSWLTATDAERIEAYRLYEAMYWGVPETFKLTWRGSEENPIYVPSAKTIVEACNRYLAVGFDYSLQTAAGAGGDRDAARLALDTLFRRERFFAKFTTAKRYGLIRGDSLLHVLADPAKPAGRRISILEVDPASYFPITAEDDPDKIVGVHLVDQWVADPKKPAEVTIRRQTYRKVPRPDGLNTITSELTFWELGAWDDRPGSGQKLKKLPGGNPLQELPPTITSIPVYHVMNQRAPLHPFGSSELRGLERIAGAINQAISDQELALALAGIGTYVTNSGPPQDDEGNETDWIMGPGNVVEVSGAKNEVFFERVDGVRSTAPTLDHLQWLWARMKEASATPDIATGAVDVAVAASGIALTLQMGPLLAKNAEKEDEILGVYDNMFFDLLQGWLPAYEGLVFDGVDAVPTVGDPMPVDRAAVIAEVMQLMSTDPPILSAESARAILRDKLGYEFSTEEAVAVVAEAADLAVARDPFSQRLRETEAEGEANTTGAGA